MEIHQELVKKALNHFKTADHLVYVTMPVVKDNKLMLTVLENLYLAMFNGMDSLLEYERFYKRVGPLAMGFEPRFNVFVKIMDRFNINQEEIDLIRSLKKLLEERKEAPVEFSRQDKFVICSDRYKMKTVNLLEIKEYIAKTKGFLGKVEQIIK